MQAARTTPRSNDVFFPARAALILAIVVTGFWESCFKAGIDMMPISVAQPQDAQSILDLQKLAYQSEARLYDDWSLPPLTQTLDSLVGEFAASIVLKAMEGGQIVGSVRATQSGQICRIGRLVVHPAWQRKGLGSLLLARIESMFPDAQRFALFTGSRSAANIRLYERLGYVISHTQTLSPGVAITYLQKPGPVAG